MITSFDIRLTILFVSVFLLASANSVYASAPDKVILTDWEYSVGNEIPDSTGWQRIADLSSLSRFSQEQTIWLRTVLPELSVSHPSLYIKRIRQPIQIFLYGRVIFQAGRTDEQQGIDFVRWNNLLVPLPDYTPGTMLVFKLYPSKHASSFNWRLVLAQQNRIYRIFFIQNIDNFVLAAIFLATGFAILFVFFISRRSRLLLGIIIFLFSLVIYITINNSFVQLLLPYPVLYYHADYIFWMSAIIGAFYTVEQIIEERYKKILKILWVLHLFLLLITIGILNLSSLTFPQIENYFMVILNITMITSITIMVKSVKTGEFTAKLLFGGMASFQLSAIVEIILFYYSEKYSVYSYSVRALHIGALFFVVSLIWIAIYLYLDTFKEKELAQQKELDAVKKGNKAREQFAMKLIESQESERNRIAMELHDSVGQKLLIIKNLLLSELRNLSGTKSPLEQVCDISGETIQDVRNIIYNLRPQHLDQLGLTTAIETVIEKFADSSAICFHDDLDDIDNIMSKENEINFYRIIQESLNNIVKHSMATDAFISIKRAGESIQLVVRDNGIGYKESGPSAGEGRRGFGITGMYERASMIGAEMNLGPAENGGTTMVLKLNGIKNG